MSSYSRAYPFNGKFKVTSLYGKRQAFATTKGTSSTNHKGLDLVGVSNRNIVSCATGKVVETGYNKYRGNYILIANDDGYSCLYQHLSKISVKKGSVVYTKQIIGVQGSTGNVSGSHLHFEVSPGKANKLADHTRYTINPADYLGFQNTSTIVGKQFDGTGLVTGYKDTTYTTNNTDIVSQGYQGIQSYDYTDVLLPSGEYYRVKKETFVESDWLYGRKYRVFVDIGGGKSFDVSQLRCTFEIIKTSQMEANQSIVQIYNLNPEDENKIIKQGQRIIIEAGYVGSQYGKIFVGNIIQTIRSKEDGVDYVLTLVSMDNDRYTAYGLINVALVSQQSARDAVSALASKASVTTELGYITEMNTKYPRGKVMFGMSRDYLSQIASSENSSYYSEDGKVNIVNIQQQPGNRIKSYGPRNGLIGTPAQNNQGITCTVLLDPSVKTNCFFHIDNTLIKGYQYQVGNAVRQLDNEGLYRVIKLTHRGDTRGQDWYTEIEAVSQAGLLPSMIAGSAFYGW